VPKRTFFNLPETKREKIIDAAVEEFAAYPYNRASVGRIIKRSGIACGSFYQYFSGKMDLFRYIIELIGEKKMAFMKPFMGHIEDLGFFQMIREIYLAGISFIKENPQLDAIGNNLIKDRELTEKVMGEQQPRGIKIFEEMLRKGVETGDINPELDLEITAFFMFKIGLSLGELFYQDNRVDQKDMVFVDRMLDFIKNGIKKR